MNKILAVIRREFVARVRTKAFVISTIMLPVMMLFFVFVPALMMSGSDQTARIAVVDGSGSDLGAQLRQALDAEKLGDGKATIPRYSVKVFPADGNATAVRDSLVAKVDVKDRSADNFDGVLVVTDDTLASGKAAYYGSNVGSLKAMGHLQGSVSHVLASARLAKSGIDPALVMRSMKSADLATTKVSDGKITGQSGAASFMIAYFMGFILYLSIIIYGQQTMTSVIEEKTSRIMEVLASSLTPFQMLLGKVLGVGAAGLTQMAIWGGSVFLVTSQRVHLAAMFGVSPDAMQSFPIPTMAPSLLVVFLLYFALGFLLYGALYAAIGAMCNTVQETQQYAVFVTMLIMVGFFAVFSMIGDPSGTLGTTMSFIPFFSPFVMPVRWSMASVPPLELLASLGLMVLMMLACVWFAARVYRTGILMYGKKPTFRELWRWVRAS
jgi:ABC-2 type transport system permease protein